MPTDPADPSAAAAAIKESETSVAVQDRHRVGGLRRRGCGAK